MNKILMVEPESSIVDASEERLSQAGFEMFSAYDGRQGLRIAKDKIPDLIITEAATPVISGYEFCKAIKLNQDTRSIPIIVLTEHHRLEDSFMYLGVYDFLPKPISMDELEIVVKYKLYLSQIMNMQKSKVLIYGRPEILSCCDHLLKDDEHWTGYYSENKDTFLHDAIKYAPDVVLMDLLVPGAHVEELIKKLKLIPDLKNTAILTYYTTASVSTDPITVQIQLIEVEYMKILTRQAGAKEYLGAFNPVTFKHLINVYRKDFEF